MNTHLVDKAIENGADIIITSDNGIVAFDAIDYAKSKGLQVIVTDHHIPKNERKNNADLIIDPLYNNQKFTGISGATVVLKLCLKLFERYGIKTSIEDLCSLAGLTVLSDVMPVIKENRILLKAFFNYANKEVYKQGSFINKFARLVGYYVPGKKNGAAEAAVGSFRDFDADNINFYFTPVINSVNRVNGDVNGIVKDIYNLFENESDVGNYYSSLNRTRKQMKEEIIELYENQVNNKNNDPVITVIEPEDKSSNYSGINGLAAAYIVESREVPALVAVDSESSDLYKFSGRSVPGFNLFNAFMEIKENHPEIQFQFGGHAAALGLSCPKNKDIYETLNKELTTIYNREKSNIPEKEYLLLDNPFKYERAFMSFYPYGCDFVFPSFYFKGNISKIDYKKRMVYFWELRDYGIKCFNFKDLKYLNDNTRGIEIISSFYLDEHGKCVLKLNKILR